MTFNVKDDNLITYKIFLLGDGDVGKTACIERFCSNHFRETTMTIGCDKKIKKMPLENGKIASIEIWDTAGQERYRSLTKNMFKSADAILLVYSVIDRKSFENVSNWINDINNMSHKGIPIILCGNKIDLVDKRQVSVEEGEALQTKYNVKLYEVSCKQDINVKEAFKALVKEIYLTKIDKPIGVIKIIQPKKSCC